MRWFREDVIRRVLRNTALLATGKLAGVALHLAGLALAARLLGPIEFGLLILIRSYAQAASGVAKFQSWQALIRFGTAHVETNNRTGFRDLVGFTAVLDAVSGVVAALVAVLAAPLIGAWFGLPPEKIELAQVYCLAVPLMVAATPNGILRIFDRFDQLSLQNLVTPGVRLFGIGIAALADGPFWMFVAAWLVSDLIGNSFLWRQAWAELRRRGFRTGPSPSPKRAIRENAHLIRFSLVANAAATVSQATAPLLTLYVGTLLGPAAAGLYRVAQVVLDAAIAPGELAMRSLFPEVSRLLAGDRAHFWRVIGRALALSAGLGAVLTILAAVFAPTIVVSVMGQGYAEAGVLLQIIALSFVPALIAFPLETALLAGGQPGRVVFVRGIAAVLLFAIAHFLAIKFGLLAIGLAIATSSFVLMVGMLMMTWKNYRRLRKFER